MTIQCPKCGTEAILIASHSQCTICGTMQSPGRDEPTSLRPEKSIPWEEADTKPVIAILVATIRRVLTAPTAFFAALSPSSSFHHAWIFALAIGSIGISAQYLWNSSLFSAFDYLQSQLSTQPGSQNELSSLILAPLLCFFQITVSALYCHCMLMLCRSSHARFRESFMVICYAEATSMLLLVPVVGILIAPVWHIVVLIKGLSVVHRISGRRSTFSLLLPLLIAAVIVLFILTATLSGGMIATKIIKEILSTIR